MASGVKAAGGEVFAGDGALGRTKLLFKPQRCLLVDVEELAALTAFAGFFRAVELALGQRDVALLSDDADGFRESYILNLADEGENVAGNAAAEAVVELADGVDGERGRLFFMERAEAGVVLRASFFEAHVFADDLDDVSLLLHGLGEIRHGRWVRLRGYPKDG